MTIHYFFKVSIEVVINTYVMSEFWKKSQWISPVVSFLGEQFFELSQCDDSPFYRRPVRYQLLAEVIGHGNVLTRLLLSGFVSAKWWRNTKTDGNFIIINTLLTWMRGCQDREHKTTKWKKRWKDYKYETNKDVEEFSDIECFEKAFRVASSFHVLPH